MQALLAIQQMEEEYARKRFDELKSKGTSPVKARKQSLTMVSLAFLSEEPPTSSSKKKLKSKVKVTVDDEKETQMVSNDD